MRRVRRLPYTVGGSVTAQELGLGVGKRHPPAGRGVRDEEKSVRRLFRQTPSE